MGKLGEDDELQHGVRALGWVRSLEKEEPRAGGEETQETQAFKVCWKVQIEDVVTFRLAAWTAGTSKRWFVPLRK